MEPKIIRTRIAPSPTGEFHIGSLRTLIYNYAWARKNHGQFIIRVEDTDRTRFVEGSMNRMLEVVQEFGLIWDEGPIKGGQYSPYIQSERLNIYREYIDKLLVSKHAYYCFCSPERLADLREVYSKEGRKFKYDRHCLMMSENEINEKIISQVPYTIRMKMPIDELVSFNDLILGEISFSTNDIDDQVLIKSDGFPTYHFAVVVDDHLMKITHILRGPEWLTSTPKHILLYKFFNFETPRFGHIPNLKFLGSNKKMSKRDGNTAVIDFLKDGYLPEAILNHLMFLGWNPGTEKEIYSLEEFTNDFTLEKIHSTDLVTFDFDKLNWFNTEYLKKLSDKEFLNKLKYWSNKFNMNCLIGELEKNYLEEQVFNIIRLSKERLINFSEFDKNIDYFLNKPSQSVISLGKYSNNPQKILEFFYESILSLENFSFEKLHSYLHDIINENNYSMKEYFMTLRISITGESVTPPIIDIISILGKEETLSRIKKSIDCF